MQSNEHEIDEALDAVLAGRLDKLSPDAVARLEERLMHDPEAERRLAGASPAVESLLRAAVPDADHWDAVWERIDDRTAGHNTGQNKAVLRWMRFVPPALAAAACLAMILVWNLGRPTPTAEWPVQWAQNVEVESLEVPGTGTPFVFTAGSDQSISIIWVLPAES